MGSPETKIDKDWLYKEYHINNKTTRQIAKIVKCSKTTVRVKLNKYSIPIKPPEKPLATTIEQAKLEFSKEGYVLLSETYKNNRVPLKYKCPEGHTRTITWKSWAKGRRCQLCHFKNSSGKNHPMYRGGFWSRGVGDYNTFARQIEFCEEVREKSGAIQVRCTEVNCRKWFTPTIDQLNNRIKGVYLPDYTECRFYCSDECKQICPIYGKHGNLPSPKKYKSRSYEYTIWANIVKERDNYECQKCGSIENPIAHHIEGINVNPIMSLDIDMGITVCKKCHKQIHKEEGCRFTDLRCGD